MTDRFEGVVCWKNERISQVINKEAVSVEVADFFATHTPISQIRYGTFDEASRQIQQSEKGLSEAELLSDFQRYAAEDRHVFGVLQSIPGTGKSHLIRWLKLRYEEWNKRENQQRDVVLLIERARCNLRDTLKQIIESDIFQEKEMREQLEKLKFASAELSRGTLGDKLLNALQEASKEVKLQDFEMVSRWTLKRVEGFLLDPVIREELKKASGPIDRLIRFLSDTNKGKVSRDNLPQFLPEDFDFNPDLLYKLRDEGSRYETIALVERMTSESGHELAQQTRKELARYLSHNKMLNYAVGRVSNISAEDLKQMFLDLREHLKRNGRNLALFIEDIAAFTGIDLGLIDVLITQHTGEGGRALCRMFSVVGVTEDYYNDKLPDNIKGRATHTLSLGVTQRNNRRTLDILDSPSAVAEMSARYLNAMRLSKAALEEWKADGARSDTLPNACSNCSYKEKCHSAFGKENIGTLDNPSEVGLYPFNQTALWTMYSRTTNNLRTPRTLLSSVLEHVLDRHGAKIPSGQFPPESNLGSEIEDPPLDQLQAAEIRQQGGEYAAGRLLTFIRYWSQADERGSQRLISDLSEAAFKAFSLPPTTTTVISKVERPVAPPREGVTGQLVPPPPEVRDIFTPDITNWLEGGKLQQYDKLRELLFNLLKMYIDWEAYGITSVQLNERFDVPSRIYIEDQAAVSQTDSVKLARSQELGLVLTALADTATRNYNTWETARFGGHLANLGRWLRRVEPDIVLFVKSPGRGQPEPRPLLEISLLNNLVIDWLLGRVNANQSEFPAILLGILKSCGSDPQAGERLSQQIQLIQAEKSHSTLWHDLIKSLNCEEIIASRRELLKLLNRAQGESADVRYVDAAAALDILQSFHSGGWQLPDLADFSDEKSSPNWIAAFKLYRRFQAHLTSLKEAEYSHLAQHLAKLKELKGSHTPEEVFKSIEALMLNLQRFHRQGAHKFTVDSSLTPTGLRQVLGVLQNFQDETDPTIWLHH